MLCVRTQLVEPGGGEAIIGTNFYVEADPTCDNPAHVETLHIGKSSAGWKFGFHGYPEHDPPLTSWRAWQTFLDGRAIHDEYGRPVGLEEFTRVVEDRRVPEGRPRLICRVEPTPEEVQVGYGGDPPPPGDYHDPEGYDFYDGEFS